MTRLAGYELLVHLGDGGMGTVWLARQRTGGLVAVKTLKGELAHDVRVRSMFAREMRVAAAIRHPNVATLLTSGEHDGIPYLVMEWVDGRSLRALGRIATQRGGIPLGVALRIAHDVCAGLHAAHELVSSSGEHLGLVHRDVSPHNILIARTGVTKLIDFGVAKLRETVTGETTSSGSVKGKVRYMAPEQALARAIDRRADIFALGAVLFEMITGRPAFEAANDLALVRALVSSARVVIPASVPAPIAAVLSCALAKRPGDRYATADAMRAALARAMFDCGVSATREDVAAFMAWVEPEEGIDAEVVLATSIFATTIAAPAEMARSRRPPSWLLWSAAAMIVTLVGTASSLAWMRDAAAASLEYSVSPAPVPVPVPVPDVAMAAAPVSPTATATAMATPVAASEPSVATRAVAKPSRARDVGVVRARAPRTPPTVSAESAPAAPPAALSAPDDFTTAFRDRR